MKSVFLWLRRAALIPFACVAAPTFADNVWTPEMCVLSWTPPAFNDDGSPLTDLAGYYIYTGGSPDSLTPSFYASGLQVVLYYPPGGTHYFAVTAVSVDGIESSPTPVVSSHGL